MPPKPLEPGDPLRLGRFELLGRLGEGGQGIVYLGRGTNPGEDRVAVKVLRSTVDATVLERLARELDAIHQVQPFVTAGVIEASAEGDRRFVVSEFIDGPSLQERVDARGPLSEGDLQRLAVGTATALTAIHGAGVMHRDFSWRMRCWVRRPPGRRLRHRPAQRRGDDHQRPDRDPLLHRARAVGRHAAHQRRRRLRVGADHDLRRYRPAGVRRRQRARRHAPHHVRGAGPERPAAVPADDRPGVPGQGSGPAAERSRSPAPPRRSVGAANPGRSHRPGRPRRFDTCRPLTARATPAGHTGPLPPLAEPTISGAGPARFPGPGPAPARLRRGAILAVFGAAMAALVVFGIVLLTRRSPPGPPAGTGSGSLAARPAARRPRARRRPRRRRPGPRSRPRSRAPGKARRRCPPSGHRASA